MASRFANPVVVASQMGAGFNAAFVAACPFARLIPIPMGVPRNLSPDVDVLFARGFHRQDSATPPPPEGWPFGLKWIQLLAVGADLFPPWIHDGPVVTSGRGWSAEALAEFALAMIFAQAKRIPDVWIRSPASWAPVQMSSVSGANLGLFGFGSIGKALAPKAHALGMNVAAVRRTESALPTYVERMAAIGALFRWADHVVLAAPATPETWRIVDEKVLAGSKPGLHLINIGRGSLVDEAALLRALDDGLVSRASLDTIDIEPAPEGHPLYNHPKVRLSPHTAVFTPEAPDRQLEKFLRNMARYASGQPLEDPIDRSLGY